MLPYEPPIHPSSAEFELCELMQTMQLAAQFHPKEELTPSRMAVLHLDDVSMAEDPNYFSDATSECSAFGPSDGRSTMYGCAYLQAIKERLDQYPTTGGDYLDAIFTHREIFLAYPGAHQECARLYSDIAYAIEQRAWRADRDADTEAVAAFRHEAWLIASSLDNLNQNQKHHTSRTAFACTMPLM